MKKILKGICEYESALFESSKIKNDDLVELVTYINKLT